MFGCFNWAKTFTYEEQKGCIGNMYWYFWFKTIAVQLKKLVNSNRQREK